MSFLQSELGCRKCGEKDIRVLQADHIDRKNKGRTSSGKLIQFAGMPIAELAAELAKAQFLCGWLYPPPLILHCLSQYFYSRVFVFSCHRHKTHLEHGELRKPLQKLSGAGRSNRRVSDILQARVNEHKVRIGSCAACGRKVGLEYYKFDFDHQDRSQKIACISEMVQLRLSSSKIWEEIKKCLFLCANCHGLKSNHKKNLTPRERKVFKKLTKGHSMNINPYDGRNYFKDDKAFLQFKLCITYDMREDSDWCRPEDSFFAPLPPPPPQRNNSTSFSQISWVKRPLGFRFSWRSTSGLYQTQDFPLSHYDGDRDIALGAALAYRKAKRAEGISYHKCQEDSAREQELIAKFRAWQGSSPAPPASAPRPLRCTNSTSFCHISWSKQPPGFRFFWHHTSQRFSLSRYDGDREIALGAALFFRKEKCTEGIPYREYQEDSARKQELIAKFLAWQGSSPAAAAPPASAPPSSSSERAEERQGSSPAPPASPPSSSPSFEEELDPEERRAWADMDRLLEDRLGRRGRKRETSTEEEKSHPPKRHRRHSLRTPSFSSSSSSFKMEEMLVRSEARNKKRKREAGESCYRPKRRRRRPLELL